MNIAMISYWSCPLTRLGVLASGGMNVYVLNLANYLGLLGQKVDIFTQVHKESDEKIIEIHKNVRIIHTSFSGKKNLYQDIAIYALRVLDFINKNSYQYDLIHSHYFYSGLVGLQLKKTLSISLVHTFHTLGIIKALYGGIKDKKRIEKEIEIARSVDGIIASTSLEKQELINHYQANKEKIFVVSPGVNHHLFKKHARNFSRRKLNLPQKQKIILFVGRIDPIKGISFLIEALALFDKNHPNFSKKFKVILIGGDINSRHFWENSEVRKIKELIHQRNLSCCIKFFGSSPYHLLPFYYSAADLVVMPSVYESFGFVVLEAMACQTAVIASKAGGLTYLVKDKVNGRLFDNGNISQLSKLIYELLINNFQRKKLGNNALAASRNFCWNMQAAKFIQVYKKFA